MASRPVFIAKNTFPFYETKDVEFTYHSGFAASQKQKNIRELHDSFARENQEPVLEVSTKSADRLGVLLSAFNLHMYVDDKKYALECIFQGSKVFENGGPFADLYDALPCEAKKDSRLRESGNVTGFRIYDEYFCNEPKDFFYNWIYIKSLYQHKKYLDELKKYGAFTDIEFNPKKSINCQAKAVAMAVGLMEAGLLDECIKDTETFLKIVYMQN